MLSLSLSILLAVLAIDPPQTESARGNSLFRPEMFRTLVDPDCSYCRDEAKRAGDALRPDDRVLAWIRGAHDGGAIPYRFFLVPYRVISDSYGVFVYDPDADFVRGWPASYDFRFHGWRNGVMVMSRKDGTLFDCLTGKAFAGPGQGTQLDPLPTLETNWGPWLKANPGTVAYTMKPQFQPVPLPQTVLPESRQTRPAPDARLGSEERVFGLAIGAASRAWPVADFGATRSVRSVLVGDQPAVLFWEPSTRSAVAFAPQTEGKNPERVQIVSADEGASDAPFIDEQGSHWSIIGRCLSGPRKGQTLRWLPGVMIKWYAWVASYPETALARPDDRSSPR